MFRSIVVFWAPIRLYRTCRGQCRSYTHRRFVRYLNDWVGLWIECSIFTVGGDVRRAMGRLRGGARTKTHHFSTFRSGLLIGVGLPALAAGIYQSKSSMSFHRHSLDFILPGTLDISYDSIEAFDALLYIYGVLFIPVCFSLLVGLNVVVWARSRVNYSFIFGM